MQEQVVKRIGRYASGRLCGQLEVLSKQNKQYVALLESVQADSDRALAAATLATTNSEQPLGATSRWLGASPTRGERALAPVEALHPPLALDASIGIADAHSTFAATPLLQTGDQGLHSPLPQQTVPEPEWLPTTGPAQLSLAPELWSLNVDQFTSFFSEIRRTEACSQLQG